jgi:hypothetical protein
LGELGLLPSRSGKLPFPGFFLKKYFEFLPSSRVPEEPPKEALSGRDGIIIDSSS